jgi:hypothetical protein
MAQYVCLDSPGHPLHGGLTRSFYSPRRSRNAKPGGGHASMMSSNINLVNTSTLDMQDGQAESSF